MCKGLSFNSILMRCIIIWQRKMRILLFLSYFNCTGLRGECKVVLLTLICSFVKLMPEEVTCHHCEDAFSTFVICNFAKFFKLFTCFRLNCIYAIDHSRVKFVFFRKGPHTKTGKVRSREGDSPITRSRCPHCVNLQRLVLIMLWPRHYDYTRTL